MQVFELARRILWSQQDLDAGNMQDFTLEGNNTLAEGGRGEIFSVQAEPSFKRSIVKSFNFQLILSCVFVRWKSTAKYEDSIDCF